MKVMSVDFVVDEDRDVDIVLDAVTEMCECSSISILSWTNARDLTVEETDLAEGLGIIQDESD